MEALLQPIAEKIAAKKARFDQLRPLSQGDLRALQKFYDIDLTYTSNAIEGNTLTLRETAELIEHGITVGGKPLRDHLEAVDHYDAVLFVRDLASGDAPLGEPAVREIHRRIVLRSQPEIAGVYSSLPRRTAGSPVVFPNPLKIPELMRQFGEWLAGVDPGVDPGVHPGVHPGADPGADPAPSASFEAHFRLSAIHPFSDGNGRTCRLLMNLLLLRGGYPPVAVRMEDRNNYLDALECASLTEDLGPFQLFMHQRLDRTLEDYLAAL